MSLQQKHQPISVDDYLNFELSSDSKHEFYAGEIFAMTGASINHNLLSLNIANQFMNKLKDTPCQTFMADVKLKVGQDIFYPDVMVVCAKDDESKIYKTAPLLIVEVVSKSTSKLDHTYKRLRYQNIPSLEEYVLIEQYQGMITVFTGKDGWRPSYYYLGDEITFYSIGATVSAEEIYYRVDNEDVIAFLQERNQAAG